MSNSTKQKVNLPKHDSKCTGVTNVILTQSRTLQFFTASSSIPIAVAATLILCTRSTWSFITATWATCRQTTMIVETALPFPFSEDITRGKNWHINSKPLGKIAKTSSIDHNHAIIIIIIIMQSCSLQTLHLHWRKSFCVLFTTDVNTASLIERLHISSASVMLQCWQNLSKLTNQRVYQIPVYQNDLLLSLPASSFASSHCAFFIFQVLFFCTASQ